MNVTEQDRERALRLLLAIPDSTDRVSTVAQALADERERARAPFLAVTRFVEEAAEDRSPAWMRVYRDIAARLRAAAEDPQ